ncbi:MAG: hypothetical protein M3O67_02955 [Bacteroidota bacterium]|nr:hypothetical protein [Bacteroidota bacterium]
MKSFYWLITLSLLATNLFSAGQGRAKRDSIAIFKDDKPLNVTLITDIKMLQKNKFDMKYQNAVFTIKLPDSSTVTEEILIQTRGKARIAICDMPSMRLNFRTPSSPNLSFLKEIKLVNTCENRTDYGQLLIKEYLVYKIYNLLTEMSLKVRLLNLTYQDIKGAKKPFTQYAFLLEDIDDMAARNGCKECEIKNMHDEHSNRQQMTMVSVFQYMIGNTDWSVMATHNIKMMRPKKDTLAPPYIIPFDFDYGGLVNAEYAVAPANLPIESVRDRLYRGYPRTMEELQATLQIYNQQKEKIYALINNCEQLQSRHRKDMIGYLDDFYKTINNKKEVQKVFIDNARPL